MTYDLYKRIMDCVDKDTRVKRDGPNLHPTYLEARALLYPLVRPALPKGGESGKR